MNIIIIALIRRFGKKPDILMKLRERSSGKVREKTFRMTCVVRDVFLCLSFGTEVVLVERFLYRDSVGAATVI